MTKTFMVAALAAVAPLALAAPVLAQTRAVATQAIVVDTGRIFNECTACRAAQAQLKSQADALQARQRTLAAPLQTEAQALDAAGKALGGKPADAALQARATAFQQRQQAAQAELARGEEGFNRNRQFVAQQIGQRLNPIIVATMKARGANVAVDPQSVLAYEPGLDVTADVLAQLNTQLPTVSVTAPPAAATAQPARPATQGR